MTTEPKARHRVRAHTIFSWRRGQGLSDREYLQQMQARFWAKVDKSPGQGPKGECWEFRGSKAQGYGRLIFCHNGVNRPVPATRISFFLTHGHWPRHHALHKCDNPPCVRPDHLWDGTPKQNTRDAMAKGRVPTAKPDKRIRQLRVRFTSEHLKAIRDARLRKRANIYDIGQLLEMNYTGVFRFETGERPSLPIEKAHALLQYLGLNIDFSKCETYVRGLAGKKPGTDATPIQVAKITPVLPHQTKKEHVFWSRLPPPSLELYRSDLIRLRLRRTGKTLTAIRKEIGLSLPTVVRSVYGGRLKPSTVLLIAAYCGLTAAQIFPDEQKVAA